MGDAMLGTVTAGFYSTVHPSAPNRAFIEAFKQANPTFRPNLLAVSGYVGMHLIYSALEKSHGSMDGDVLVSAMTWRGKAHEAPCPSTRRRATWSTMSIFAGSKE